MRMRIPAARTVVSARMNLSYDKLASSLGAGLALLAFGAGCANPYVDVCERGAICRSASDRDIDACIIEQESREEIASIWGCDDQWSAYIDCMTERGTCSGDKLSGCDDQKDAWKRCVE
jgi:hypothetical protein